MGALTSGSRLRTYAELRRGVQAALLQGQREIEAAKVHTYWKTGRLISEHLQLHERRPEYGKEVMQRLARDLQISDTVLYRCVGFAQSFPILADRPKLSWAHYRALIPVADLTQRKELERSAIKNGWTCTELEDHIRPLRLLGDASDAGAPERGDGTPAKALTPKRGTPGVYRLTFNGDTPVVDLGFTSYLDLTAEQAGGLKAGSLVRLDAKGKVAPADDAKTSDLYTYRAEIIRVVDGDTLWMKIYLRPRHWLKEKLRLRGLDCPEMDTAEGKVAKQFVEALVSRVTAVTITTTKPDKYDRYLSDIFLKLNSGGSSVETPSPAEEVFLNNLLLENGHAVRKDSYTLQDWAGPGEGRIGSS